MFYFSIYKYYHTWYNIITIKNTIWHNAIDRKRYTIIIKFENLNKYELTKDSIVLGEHKLYRIKALKDFGDVKAGDLGGYIESEKNLSHEDNCWVYDNAKVYGDSTIADNAKVKDTASVVNSDIKNNAEVFDNAFVKNAIVCDNAQIYGNSQVYYNRYLICYAFEYTTIISDNAQIYGNATITNCYIKDNADISGYVNIEHSTICDNVYICGNNKKIIISKEKISGDTRISDT